METFLAELSLLFGWLLRSTVQVSVLVCVVLALKGVLGNRLAGRWHYYLWLVVVARMVMPWAPESRMSVFNMIPYSAHLNRVEFTSANVAEENLKTGQIKGGPGYRAESQNNIGTTDVTFKQFFAEKLPLIWLAGAVVLVIYVCIANLSLWMTIKGERVFTEQRILDLLEDCKAQMGTGTVLGLVVTDKVKSPALFGFVRPRLVLPAGIIETLGLGALRHIFLHELAHLKRYDILLNWLTSLILVMHWFNPLVWYAFYRMRLDRELACDGLALSRMRIDESESYGQTMVRLLEKFSQSRRLPILAGVLEDKSQLKRRVAMISRFKKSSYQRSIPAVIVIVVLGCVTLTDAESTTSKTQVKAPAPAVDLTKTLDIKPETKAPAPAVDLTKTLDIKPETKAPAPKIVVEKAFHHFGEVGPQTSNVCEFKFTNIGDRLLKIKKIQSPCGCTVPKLNKKEYAPGESGTVKVTYKASKRAGSPRQHVYIHSNDKTNPKVKLTIRANIVLKVDHEPKKLSLSLKEKNAGCPEITLASLDNQPFSIRRFNSTADCVTADYESSAKKTRFVLRPKVDIEKLRKSLNGRIKISVTHPECNMVTIPFSALPEFEISPPSLTIFNTEPNKPVIKDVWIFGNYGDDFEIEDVLLKRCCIVDV
ncbi:MAG: M56 family metallopeptidase, partial [Planctomycetota bacterium]